MQLAVGEDERVDLVDIGEEVTRKRVWLAHGASQRQHGHVDFIAVAGVGATAPVAIRADHYQSAGQEFDRVKRWIIWGEDISIPTFELGQLPDLTGERGREADEAA